MITDDPTEPSLTKGPSQPGVITLDLDETTVVVFNLKRRFTGVSATVNGLLPAQKQLRYIAYCGTVLPNSSDRLSVLQAISVSRRPPSNAAFRIWHLRRDHEMLIGIFARDVLRLPIRLVFTSAAQHLHGPFPRWLISKMDAVIATTTKAAAFVPNTTAVIPHGINTAHFMPPQDKREAWRESGLPGEIGIGVFGRVRPDKGTDIFVEALIATLPRFPKATAVIAGLTQPRYQSFQAALAKKIDDAGLSERILFLGEIPANEVHSWYQRCLICVACPRYEPFGLTPFEAAASGCALVCSKTGAFDALVEEGANGHLLPENDSNHLAAALAQLLTDTHGTARMGIEARERVTCHFSIEREAEAIDAVYERLFRAAALG